MVRRALVLALLLAAAGAAVAQGEALTLTIDADEASVQPGAQTVVRFTLELDRTLPMRVGLSATAAAGPVTFDQNPVDLIPGMPVAVNATLRVPANATPGEYQVVLLAREEATSLGQTPAEARDSILIRVTPPSANQTHSATHNATQNGTHAATHNATHGGHDHADPAPTQSPTPTPASSTAPGPAPTPSATQ
ncbi:MAG TPA: hypothetical protein VHH36_07570, partial [Candidatus Thermoplasmatota archaeon]|nr:hypothetical protein [Candidatus Thermoplasmatota archaeon]